MTWRSRTPTSIRSATRPTTRSAARRRLNSANRLETPRPAWANERASAPRSGRDVYPTSSRNARTRSLSNGRRSHVVVRQAVVGEQVPVARVQEQLGAVDRLASSRAAGRSSSTHSSSSIMWICSGTPAGHASANSDAGRAAVKNNAPLAPAASRRASAPASRRVRTRRRRARSAAPRRQVDRAPRSSRSRPPARSRRRRSSSVKVLPS